MKKIISVFILSVLLVLTTLCYAASDTTITSEGDTTKITAGSTNTITLKLNCNILRGGVMGTIESSSNITIDEVTALNGWNITSYNSGNGQFSIVKSEGGQNEDFMKIKYTVANAEGTGNIGIKNITTTDIVDYEDVDVDAFTKTITIIKQQDPSEQKPEEQKPEEQKPEEQKPEEQKPEEQKPEEQKPSEQKPEEQKPSEQKPSSQKDQTPAGNLKPTTQTQKDDTTLKKEIDNAGLTIELSVLIVGAIVLGIVAYIKYRKYKEIK